VVKIPVISISLPAKLIAQVDNITEREGYASRSEIIRKAIRTLVSEDAWLTNQSDITFIATITILYEEDSSSTERLSAVFHKYTDLIKARTHSHLHSEYCLEVLVCHGKASEIKKLKEDLTVLRGIRELRLVTIKADA
jgi:nickel-responsive transcriptional regulator NikR